MQKFSNRPKRHRWSGSLRRYMWLSFRETPSLLSSISFDSSKCLKTDKRTSRLNLWLPLLMTWLVHLPITLWSVCRVSRPDTEASFYEPISSKSRVFNDSWKHQMVLRKKVGYNRRKVWGKAPRPQGGASRIAETFQSRRKCGCRTRMSGLSGFWNRCIHPRPCLPAGRHRAGDSAAFS